MRNKRKDVKRMWQARQALSRFAQQQSGQGFIREIHRMNLYTEGLLILLGVAANNGTTRRGGEWSFKPVKRNNERKSGV